jgi:hypothetical protein
MWNMNSWVLMQQRATSFCPDWTCGLSGSWMEGWCIVPFVIAHISVRGWAHGRVVEGGRVHAKDKIIRNWILQARSGHRNVVEADEWDMDVYNFSLWSIWRVMELQRSLYGEIVAVLWIQHQGTDSEYNFHGNLIASTSHLAPFGMTYNFSCA